MKEFKNSNRHPLDRSRLKPCCHKTLLSSCMVLFSLSVSSQEKQLQLTPVDSLLPMLGGLVVILFFIFGLAFLFKRFTNFSPNSKNIKILETQMIGTKEKLVIVKVQQQKFLIGVTANSISQLGELDLDNQSVEEDILNSSALNESEKAPDFKSVLSNIVRKSVGLPSTSNDVNKLAG